MVGSGLKWRLQSQVPRTLIWLSTESVDNTFYHWPTFSRWWRRDPNDCSSPRLLACWSALLCAVLMAFWHYPSWHGSYCWVLRGKISQRLPLNLVAPDLAWARRWSRAEREHTTSNGRVPIPLVMRFTNEKSRVTQTSYTAPPSKNTLCASTCVSYFFSKPLTPRSTRVTFQNMLVGQQNLSTHIIDLFRRKNIV